MKILVLMIIAAIVSELTKRFLAKSALYSPLIIDDNERTVILEYASTLKLASVVFPTTIVLMLASPLFYVDIASLEFPYIAFSAILFVTLVGIVLMLEAFFKRVILNEEGIRLIGKFGEVEIFWKDIETVTYNRWLKIFTIHAWDGRQLKVNPSLSGIQFLESMLWERVETIRFRQALRGFRLREQGLG